MTKNNAVKTSNYIHTTHSSEWKLNYEEKKNLIRFENTKKIEIQKFYKFISSSTLG